MIKHREHNNGNNMYDVINKRVRLERGGGNLNEVGI